MLLPKMAPIPGQGALQHSATCQIFALLLWRTNTYPRNLIPLLQCGTHVGGKGAHKPTGEIPPCLPLPSMLPPLRKLFPGSDEEELTYMAIEGEEVNCTHSLGCGTHCAHSIGCLLGRCFLALPSQETPQA